MLLHDMMKRIRFLLGGLVLILGLTATTAHSQSAYQYISFSVLAQYNLATNDVPSEPDETVIKRNLVMVTSTNIVKAIAVDAFGVTNWTNWSSARLLRRINLVTGAERIYLNKGATNEVDVSSYFGATYTSNFTSGVSAAFPAATNNFAPNNPNPYETLYAGTNTTYFTAAGLFFISLNTTNLKMNLVGANFSYLGNGALSNYSGTLSGTNYSGVAVEGETISVIGSFSWTPRTNIFDVDKATTNTFYSGPARGTVTVGVPAFSKLALPAPDL
jgi:hypothetical protein